MHTDVGIHTPVLCNEVIEYLAVRSGGRYVDATLGAGGHARHILGVLRSNGMVLGIERDQELARKIKKESLSHLVIEEGNYTEMKRLIKKHAVRSVDGVLFDFGMNSWHIEGSGRGFSFLRDEPLDMRYSVKDETTAAEIINTYPESDIAEILSVYGEERNARKIAHAIVRGRREGRILTTGRLLEVLSFVLPRKSGRTHPATKIFQALRIAVNRELDAVRIGLTTAMELVGVGGRVVAISFHSLEDRIVKETFRMGGGLVLTKKPIRASRAEVIMNPRSRSALLRAWERV